MAQENKLRYEFVQNFSQQHKIFGVPKRNLFEGVIAAGIVGYLIHFIPFVFRVQVIVTGCVCLSVLAAFTIGIHNRSVTEFMVLWFRYKFFKRNYHLRSVKYGKYKSKEQYDDNGQRYSYAEQGFKIAQNFLNGQKDSKKKSGEKPTKTTVVHRKK